MAFSMDLTTRVGQVRLLIPDRLAPPDNLFENEEIEALLALETNDVRLAAAMALEILASDNALTLKVMRLLDLQTDGAKVSEALLARAQTLRDQADEVTGGFDWAEMVTNLPSARERLRAQILRRGL